MITIREAFTYSKGLVGLLIFLHHFLPLGDLKESPFFLAGSECILTYMNYFDRLHTIESRMQFFR